LFRNRLKPAKYKTFYWTCSITNLIIEQVQYLLMKRFAAKGARQETSSVLFASFLRSLQQWFPYRSWQNRTQRYFDGIA
jgi:hypothetical protein